MTYWKGKAWKRAGVSLRDRSAGRLLRSPVPARVFPESAGDGIRPRVRARQTGAWYREVVAIHTAEAESGILLADTCGFGKYSIDIRLALAETYLAAGDAREALQNARNALDRSEHPDCHYAWGRADGLHFCGLAHLRLGEHKLARQRLTAALKLREQLGHGRLEETRRALALI